MTRARDLGDFIADGGAPELVVDTTTLVVDSTNNRVGIGTASPATALDVVGNATITTADNTAQLTLVSTDADANAGPILKLRRNSASPADNDLIGAIDWTSENSSGDEHDFLNLTARMRDVTAGSEDVAYAWTAYLNGTGREIQSFVNTDASAASMVFNEDSQDIDFRVESNGNANMLFVDAGNDRVGIGTGSPSHSFTTLSGTANTAIAKFSGAEGARGLVIETASTTRDDDTVVFNASDAFGTIAFETDSTERFRIGSSGQLGIGGATYGTSGQVLTSGGSGAAPSWVDAGGGAWQFIASVTASAASLAALPSIFSSTYDFYKIVATDVHSDANQSGLYMKVTWNNGTSYHQTSHYNFTRYKSGNNTPSQEQYYYSSGHQFYNEMGQAGTALHKTHFEVSCFRPNQNTTVRLFRFDGGGYSSNSQIYHNPMTGWLSESSNLSNGALTGVGFETDNNTSGTFRAYGLVKS